MLYNIIFFDLDGTLTDSAPGIINSIKYALKKMNYQGPDLGSMNQFIGPPLLESFNRFCGFNEEESSAALKYYREYFTSGGMFENSVYDGVEKALLELKKLGCRLFVATSKPEAFARSIIDHFNLGKYFEFVGGASMDETRNTKPEVIRYVMKECDIRHPENVLMIGDRYQDVEGAAEVGIDCAGILYGYGDRSELEGAGAAYVLETAADVVKLVSET